MDQLNEKGEKETPAAPPAEGTQVIQSSPENQPAPEPSGNPSTDGGVTPGGKTYTEAEMTSIMHERTKGMSDMRKQLDAYRSLGSVEEIQALRKMPVPNEEPKSSEPVLDDEEKKFRNYLLKLMPELTRMETLKGLDGDKVAFLEQLREREVAQREAYVSKSEQDVAAYCDSLNIKEESKQVMVRDMIATIIMNSPEVSKKWAANDPSAVKDAVEIFKSTLGLGQSVKTQLAEEQGKAAAKTKAATIKAPIPPGGVSAPITKERKLTDEERLDAAFRSLTATKA